MKANARPGHHDTRWASFIPGCLLQDNAQQMKSQLEQQKKATDTLIGNTRYAQTLPD